MTPAWTYGASDAGIPEAGEAGDGAAFSPDAHAGDGGPRLASEEIVDGGTESAAQAAGDGGQGCPPDMVLVDTTYCPDIERTCVDKEYSPQNHITICHRFSTKQRCL